MPIANLKAFLKESLLAVPCARRCSNQSGYHCSSSISITLKARGDLQVITHKNENVLGRRQVLLKASRTMPTIGYSVPSTARPPHRTQQRVSWHHCQR